MERKIGEVFGNNEIVEKLKQKKNEQDNRKKDENS